MTISSLLGIYDFEFFPYALGDVLTWNVRTAMRCEELGKEKVDIYICLDKKYPASIYQRGLVNPDNFELFFSELYGAFGTHPKLGNISIFRDREALLEQLKHISLHDQSNLEIYQDYLGLAKPRISDNFFYALMSKIDRKARNNVFIKKIVKRFVPKIAKQTILNSVLPEHALNDYFIKYVYSHEKINEFAQQRGHIPLLQPSLGCSPDVDELIGQQFQHKKIVPFHLRLRRLDIGYGGDHSYERDSNFIEWYEFLKNAGEKYPEVQFVALGRLQEKPLALLKLPNVTSLRIYGMGLGHELTLMLKSDLFIGSSSGFAAFANFSELPYFITRMNPGSCQAYAIPEGSDKLPFAKENQKLIYETETSTLLMQLLEKGLSLSETENTQRIQNTSSTMRMDISQFLDIHKNPHHSARTTSRFFIHDAYSDTETAYLLQPHLEKAEKLFQNNSYEEASNILNQMQELFSEICQHLPVFLSLKEKMKNKIGNRHE